MSEFLERAFLKTAQVSIEAPVPLTEELDLEGLVKAAADHTADVTDDVPIVGNKAGLWRRADAHPALLALMTFDLLGQECLDWSSDTLKTTLERKGVAISNSAFIKLLAIRPLFTSPVPWRRWEVFNWIATGLAGSAPNFESFETPRVAALIHAVNVMRMIDPKREFGEEVQKFVATTLKHDGIVYAPAPLEFAQPELEERKLHCTSCKAEHRDDDDLKCITCGSKSLEAQPFVFGALRDQTKKLFDAGRRKPIAEAVGALPHDSAGEAAYALLTQTAWAEDQRKALRSQLKALR
jgi:hypothetical protein